MTPSPLEQLIRHLARLPGIGQRSARRMALQLLKQRDTLMLPLADSLRQTAETIQNCEVCGNWDDASPCHICSDTKRDHGLICVVEEVGDIWAMERGRVYQGVYHVLGGTLSALEGRGPEHLHISTLVQRARSGEVREVILATNATLEGQTTAHYLTDRLRDCEVKLSRLSQGIPLGGELDYMDEGTLGAAMRMRQPF
jgi:recombination protein RecR